MAVTMSPSFSSQDPELIELVLKSGPEIGSAFLALYLPCLACSRRWRPTDREGAIDEENSTIFPGFISGGA